MQFGIMVKNLGVSELNWRLIKQANELTRKQLADVIFFYEDLVPYCVPPLCATMQIVEAYEYKYPLIATNITTAQKIINFPRQDKSIYYLWDLEWIRFPNEPFYDFYSIYNSKNIKMVCRNNHHKELVEELWDRKVDKLCDNANLMEILGV